MSKEPKQHIQQTPQTHRLKRLNIIAFSTHNTSSGRAFEFHSILSLAVLKYSTNDKFCLNEIPTISFKNKRHERTNTSLIF